MKVSPWARRQARRALVQALYQWQVGGADAGAVREQFLAGSSLRKGDKVFFQELFDGVVAAVRGDTADASADAQPLDARFAPLLDREIGALDPVELAILRLGTFELAHRIDVPYRVVIDEYVELAKVFGAEESHKYVNAILDGLARTLRSVETAAATPPADSAGDG